MKQTFSITIGPETVDGRLRNVRVGKDFCCRFMIYGVSPSALLAPKIWITCLVNNATVTKYWTSAYNESLGCYIATIGNDATSSVGTFTYAVTLFDDSDVSQEFVAGQGTFTVYQTIASVDSTEGGGTSGNTLSTTLAAFDGRITAIENKFARLATLSDFDPNSATDEQFRAQLETITSMLKG